MYYIDTQVGIEHRQFHTCETGEVVAGSPTPLDHLDTPEFTDLWRDVLEDKVCLS